MSSEFNVRPQLILVYQLGVRAKFQILSVVAPSRKNGYYIQSGTFLGGLESHVLLSLLWTVSCKWPVINVELSSTRNTNMIYFNNMNAFI